MKQLLLLPIVALILASCSQDIQVNTPALQAVVNDSLFYKAIDARASFNDDGSLLIQASTDIENLNILFRGLSGAQGFGPCCTNVAAFEDVDGNIFSTAPNGEGLARIRFGSDNTISGTFKFVALRNGNLEKRTFSEGVFYKVPIVEPFDADAEDDDSIPDSFTARVNTVSFNPTVIASALSGGVLTISGSTSTQDITLRFPSNTGPGDYDFTEMGAISGVYTVSASSQASLSGQLKIISNDTAARIVKGQFVFDTGGFQITDGQFTINY